MNSSLIIKIIKKKIYNKKNYRMKIKFYNYKNQVLNQICKMYIFNYIIYKNLNLKIKII